MAKKLIEQDEAALFLGVTLDSLNSLRDRGKLYPKRDAGVWKYDQEDLERYQRELSEGSGLGNSWESLSLDEISLEDNPDSVLLSEAELGESSPGAKSTIIGKSKKDDNDSGESDLRLAGDSDLKMKSGSGTNIGTGSGGDVPLEFGDSKVKLEGPTGPGDSKAGSGLFDDDEFQLEPNGSGKTPSASSLAFSLENDDSISLGDPGSDKGNNPNDTKKGKGGGSGLQLADEGELDLEGHGSDITMNAGDSGIMLVDPADSGLSLDKPLQLGGGNDELTLGEDDMITLEEQVDLEGATQLRTDADFALTPTGMGDDDSDSGSQVIALDSEEDLSGGSMFGASSDSLLTPADGFGTLGGTESVMAGAGLGTMPMMMASAAPPEAPYSVWNVVGLVSCAIFLLLGGIMIYDLSMQMWSWKEPYNYNSSVMDSLLGLFEK